MVALSYSIISWRTSQFSSVSDSSLRPLKHGFMNIVPKSTFSSISQRKGKLSTCRRPLIVRASGDGERSNSASTFVGGFILGGIIVGTLGCVYAPQISRALAGADKKDLMRKLPKFIYDEEKALEKTRKILTEKIAQLNSAIDSVSSQLRADDETNGAALTTSDEVEAAT